MPSCKPKNVSVAILQAEKRQRFQRVAIPVAGLVGLGAVGAGQSLFNPCINRYIGSH
jgi:hypothetical protein